MNKFASNYCKLAGCGLRAMELGRVNLLLQVPALQTHLRPSQGGRVGEPGHVWPIPLRTSNWYFLCCSDSSILSERLDQGTALAGVLLRQTSEMLSRASAGYSSRLLMQGVFLFGVTAKVSLGEGYSSRAVGVSRLDGICKVPEKLSDQCSPQYSCLLFAKWLHFPHRQVISMPTLTL